MRKRSLPLDGQGQGWANKLDSWFSISEVV